MPAFSLDLRKRILDACLDTTATQAAVARRFSVSLGFVEKLLRQYRTTGSITPLPRPGRARVLSTEDDRLLVRLLAEANDATLEELALRFERETGRKTSGPSVHRALRRSGITRKKRPSTPPNDTGPM